MRIGIIGSGSIGRALASRFSAAGHQVGAGNSRGPASLAYLASETGAHAASIDEVACRNDVVVVAVPLRKIHDNPRGRFDRSPADTIVIDTSNYYPRHRDGLIAGIEAGLTESRWVEQPLGHRVVKVFNSIIARMGLVDEIGFYAVEAGTIDGSWRQQPGRLATSRIMMFRACAGRLPRSTASALRNGVRRRTARARTPRPPDVAIGFHQSQTLKGLSCSIVVF